MANRLSRSCAPGRQGARSPGLGQSGRRLPAAWNGGRQTTLARTPNPVGDGEVSIVLLGLGIEGEAGVLVAGSRRDDFPSNTEVLLLRVAANQAEMGLRAARLLGEDRRERHLVDEDRRALAALVEHSSDFIAIATPGGRAGARHPDL